MRPGRLAQLGERFPYKEEVAGSSPAPPTLTAPFAHGVASGDPTEDGVVLWTRVSAQEASVPLSYRVARDRDLRDVVAAGEVAAEAEHDHAVSVDVGGLEPATAYYYGFESGGQSSPVARTRTLAGPAAEGVRFAICSCAKFNAGYFNAYARIADRDDLDFVVHLGDYIYEAGNVPAKGQTPGADIGRDFDPLTECRTLPEYRTRYAQYRSDADVQALHHALPVIATIDDHELADGAWAGGADAHVPEEHGPWSERLATAFRAREEWLPVRRPNPGDPSRVFRRVGVGELADLLLLDIRSRRDQPALEPEASDPGRSMLGGEQREWLFGELQRSQARWRLLVSPSILGRTWVVRPAEPLATALLKLKLIDEDGEGPDEDQWDGYPAEREELLARLGSAGDTIVLSGDIHVSFARAIHRDGTPLTVEITTPSLTSQNLDEKLGVGERSEEILAAERAVLAAFDRIEWCDLASHGYVVVDVDRDRVRAEWWHVDGVLEPSAGERLGAAYEVRHGSPGLIELRA